MNYLWLRIKNLFKPLEPKTGIWIGRDMFPNLTKGKWYFVAVSMRRGEKGEFELDELSAWQFPTKRKRKNTERKLIGHYKLNKHREL